MTSKYSPNVIKFYMCYYGTTKKPFAGNASKVYQKKLGDTLTANVMFSIAVALIAVRFHAPLTVKL